MTNQVTLSDDELSIIMTSLELNLMSYAKYVEEHGENTVTIPLQTVRVYKNMKVLMDRLNKEYF